MVPHNVRYKEYLVIFLGAFLIFYLNLLVLEGMPLLSLEFVFGQPPRKGEKVNVENDCREEKKKRNRQMTFKCTGEEVHDSQRFSGRRSTLPVKTSH